MSSTFNHDKELAEFFTDVEPLRDAFKEMVTSRRGDVPSPAQGGATPPLQKHILVIHGVGGVGKSSLLRMFRLHCKSVNVPVALASGDEQKSALDVLACWTDDLKADGVAFPAFGKTFEHYRAIQAKVDEQAKKAQDARGRAADIAGKAASKTAEAAGGALAGAAIGSVIPGIGTAIGGALGGVLGGMGAEALVDWLRGFLTKPDIDLLLDPAKKLTDDFLADVAPAADKRRIVLMLDTFEQMTALDDWARDVAQRVAQISNLSYGVLFVIAGRALPNWSRAWDGWMATSQVEELKPMTEDDMRKLVRRYYATMRGGQPNPVQVEAIIRFARGLPMVVTSAVQLWVKYGVEDFQSVKAEIVANLVDRLMEGVPNELIPVLEAAAIVRWFDQPILRAVTGLADVREVYNELRRFPFVRVRVEGLALHDAVREIMDENLRVQDSERHCELHERAAAYFEKRLEKVKGEEAERLGLERLYHRVRADEEAGIKLFQEMAEELVRYRLVNRLRALLNDANTYPLERENSKLWREYYEARLSELQRQLEKAENMYQSIDKIPEIELRLRSYVLCDWGGLLARPSRLNELGTEKARKVLERARQLTPPTDLKMIAILEALQSISTFETNWDLTNELLEKRIELCQKNGYAYELVSALSSQVAAYGRQGRLKDAFATEMKASDYVANFGNALYLQHVLLNRSIHWLRSGRYREAEERRWKCLELARTLGLVRDVAFSLSWLGHLVGHQDRPEAMELFERCRSLLPDAQSDWIPIALDSYCGFVLFRQGKYAQAQEYLVRALAGKKKTDPKDVPLIRIWIGGIREINGQWKAAENQYFQALDRQTSESYDVQCAALSGLVRVKHAQGDYAAIPPLLAKAEQLAQQYEYNDHLASLRLMQGHIAWEGNAPNWNNGFDATARYYQHALIYALRYNRFLLDEVLSGRPQGTPLRPIIPYCLAHGEEGRQMLTTLRDWWKTGINDIGTPRLDTISPIPEGIALLEAERIAREREPGDGSPQKSVVEQIELTLAGQGAIKQAGTNDQ